MAKIRALNKTGIKLFHKLIDARRDGKDFPVSDILPHAQYYEVTPFRTEIDLELKFEDRYELAAYLAGVLEEYDDNKNQYGLANRDAYGKSAGLWSWLALVYFNQLIDNKPNERHEYYVFVPHLGLRYYRHSVFTPFELYKRWKEDSRMFISKKNHIWGQVSESALSRDFLMSSAPAVRLMNMLYSDPNNDGAAKSGASSKPSKAILKSGKPSGAGYGSVERFAIVFKRLRLTYHVQSLTPESLLELMGDEFKKKLIDKS